MKRFFYLSAGLLCLSLAMLAGIRIGPERADAEIAQQGLIWAISGDYIWDSAGQCWILPPGGLNQGTYFRYVTGDLPVPISDVKFAEGSNIVTFSDECYQLSDGQWIAYGAFPGGPTPVEQTTWGRIKATGGQDQ